MTSLKTKTTRVYLQISKVKSYPTVRPTQTRGRKVRDGLGRLLRPRVTKCACIYGIDLGGPATGRSGREGGERMILATTTTTTTTNGIAISYLQNLTFMTILPLR